MGAIQDFHNFIIPNELIHARFIGEVYIWCNNRRGKEWIWERLDRFLLNLEDLGIFLAMSVHHLTRISSNHSTLLVQLDGEPPRILSGFIFQCIWADHPEFKDLVFSDWVKPMNGAP